ncbi:hypothetical protein [Streptomyces hygroscopicus]|uniref:hypothetical protein n=1 Tax=Streptomyces hygroscopicus TaxID=1912 RepID=UPI0033E1C24A
MTDTKPAAEWPFTLDDPTRAVHFAIEPDCPYGRPESCPREIEAQQTIGAYQTWLAAHPTADDRTVIDGQPRETGPAASHGPHSPSYAPEGPATHDRAADGRTADRITHRTVEYLLQTRQPDDTWEISSSGTNTPDRAQERLAQRRQRMPQFEHRIAKRTFTVAIEPYPDTDLDSRTDSPDSRQDSTPDTETDSPVNSADTVRTTQDTPPMDPVHILGIGAPAAAAAAPDDALREQYAAAIRALNDGGTLADLDEDDDVHRLANAVLAVRDRRMAHLAAQAARLEPAIIEQERQATRAEQAEATLARLRRLADDWAILRTHGSGAYELRATLDEPAAEQPSVAHSDTEQQASEVQQVDEPHPAEAERDQAYRERAHLLAWLAALHPANAVITTAADIDEDGWQLLYLLVGGWQMSWHIAPRDGALFEHVEHVDPGDPRAQWDGHSTDQKYRRMQEHVARLSEGRAATSTVRIEISPDPPGLIDAIRQVRRDGGLPPHHR